MSPVIASLPAAIREFAEDPDFFVRGAPPPARRFQTPAFTLAVMPSATQAAVVRIRTTIDDLDAVIAQTREFIAGTAATRAVWFVGPSARPVGLADLLAQRGFRPVAEPPFEPRLDAMALAASPTPPPRHVEVRQVRDLAEYIQALEIAMEAFEESPEGRAGWLAAAPGLWSREDGDARLTQLAFVDGQPVGFGFAAAGPQGFVLGGAGVLPAARGRGIYRALVAARWAMAESLGKPALVIHAGAMSRAILAACGFQHVCTVDVLEDPLPRGVVGR